MRKAIPRLITAMLAAGALALSLSGGLLAPSSVSAQATPMPTPEATATPMPPVTPLPSPMPPNPAVTPAGNPVPTAPSPGTDMLNNNPNGNWLDKFNRQATPDPSMRPPSAGKPMMVPPRMSARCRGMWMMAKTAAQRAKAKAMCGMPH